LDGSEVSKAKADGLSRLGFAVLGILLICTGCTVTKPSPSLDDVQTWAKFPELDPDSSAECSEILSNPLPEEITLVDARATNLGTAASIYSEFGADPASDANMSNNDNSAPIAICIYSDPTNVLQIPGTMVVTYEMVGLNGNGIIYYW